jgi:hypothetical protein
MPIDLLSFLEKLPADNSTYKLEWQGLRINKKYAELKARFLQFTHATLLALAILLQHLRLSDFTDDEITVLTELPLNLLSITNSPIATKKTLNSKQPLFDTESARVYSFINTEEVANNNKFQMAANYLDFNNSSLQEVITKLYTGGF